jgi:hypothetical protein
MPTASPSSTSIPISMNVSFPKVFDVILGGSVQFNNTSPLIPINFYYTVSILPEMTIYEKLNLFVDSWISPLGALWTFVAGIIAVLTPLVIRYIKRK